MGKKSKVKSSKKKVTAKKAHKSNGKKAVVTKQEPKKAKKSSPKKEETPMNQKIKGFLIMLIGLLLLVAAGALLYNRIFKAPALANYLPAEKTFALVELDLANSETQKLANLLDKYPVYKQSNLTNQINEFLKADFETQIKPWLGRKVGLALVQSQNLEKETVVSPVAFIEVQNFRQAIQFFESQTLEEDKPALQIINYQGQDMYEFPLGQNIYFAFIDDYLIASNTSQIVKDLIDGVKSSEPKLRETKKYNRIADNLPSTNIAFGFFDLSNLTKHILKSPNFVLQNGLILTSFEPFLSIFDAEGFTINQEGKGLKLRTYTAFNKDLLEGKEFLSFQEKYRASLSEYVSQDVLLVWGGMDLEKQLKRIADILGKGSEASLVIFDGILEAQKDIYFGEEVSLKDDLYPLIQNEFLIAIHDGEVPMLQVVLDLENDADQAKVEKLVEGFVKENAIFKPEIKEVELEDGTKGQEIVGVPEDIQKSDEDYKGKMIHSIALGSKSWGIYYMIEDDKLILASAKEIIQNLIDGKQNKLADSSLFQSNIKPIIKHADELSYINLKKLLPHIWPTVEEGDTSLTQLYLDPFQSVSSGKNYFADGISTIHYLHMQ